MAHLILGGVSGVRASAIEIAFTVTWRTRPRENRDFIYYYVTIVKDSARLLFCNNWRPLAAGRRSENFQNLEVEQVEEM